MSRWVLFLFLGLLTPAISATLPNPECGPAYAGVISDAQLEALGDQLRTAAGDGALQPEVGRRTVSREAFIDYLVEDGSFSARQMLGSDLLNVDWVENKRVALLIANAVTLSDQVGRPIRIVEGYVTAELAEKVRKGDFPLDRWSQVFSALRKEKWTVTLEKRGEKTFLVFKR